MNYTQISKASFEIIQEIEEMLESHNITIPDRDRTGSKDEARLFGEHYYLLEDAIKTIIKING